MSTGKIFGGALKKIVGRFGSKSADAPSEKIYVAAFGKHPGWNDHIDDFGLETDVLVELKRILYIDGIGGNIDAGSWDKLQGEGQSVEFGHTFLWVVSPNVVIGRLWASQDGKGRSSYPMIFCVQCYDLSLEWIWQNILPALEGIEKACQETSDSAEVYSALERAREGFRTSASSQDVPSSSLIVHPNAISMLGAPEQMGDNQEGLLRILYHLQREVGRFLGDPNSSKKKRKTESLDLRAKSLRVPTLSGGICETALLWVSFLVQHLGEDTRLLLLMPHQNPWIDIVIGEPTVSQVFAVRASLEAVPLTSSIPYTLDQEFIGQAKQLLENTRPDAEKQDSPEHPTD